MESDGLELVSPKLTAKVSSMDFEKIKHMYQFSVGNQRQPGGQASTHIFLNLISPM